jgi:NAD(P)-dependent dehydrogenase (short-subunit alcohol dehydrogenase family)
MSDLLTDTVAVVTGGASGNGRAICRAFAAHGADVVVADRREEPREGGTPTHELVAEEADSEARYVACDVTDRADLDAAVETAEGLGGIDVMVNNAGIFRGENFLDVSPDEFRQVMEVNVTGTFLGAQAAAERMVARGSGAIINMSSIAAFRATDHYTSYCASKGAVTALTYSLADLLGEDGIRVNAVHPGIIETAMTTDDVAIVGTGRGDAYADAAIPLKRFGQPSDVADACVYLASDLASYVTGESLVVDGGVTNTG